MCIAPSVRSTRACGLMQHWPASQHSNAACRAANASLDLHPAFREQLRWAVTTRRVRAVLDLDMKRMCGSRTGPIKTCASLMCCLAVLKGLL